MRQQDHRAYTSRRGGGVHHDTSKPETLAQQADDRGKPDSWRSCRAPATPEDPLGGEQLVGAGALLVAHAGYQASSTTTQMPSGHGPDVDLDGGVQAWK